MRVEDRKFGSSFKTPQGCGSEQAAARTARARRLLDGIRGEGVSTTISPLLLSRRSSSLPSLTCKVLLLSLHLVFFPPSFHTSFHLKRSMKYLSVHSLTSLSFLTSSQYHLACSAVSAWLLACSPISLSLRLQLSASIISRTDQLHIKTAAPASSSAGSR